ncbi:zinc finger, C2H2 type, partial [Cooperia oncophora]
MPSRRKCYTECWKIKVMKLKKKARGGDEIWRCKLCTRVLLRKSLYMHLRNVHGFPKEEVDDIKRQIAEEAALRATNYRWVVCPICNEKFINHTGLALHCDQVHKDDGGGGAPQDYRVFTVKFETVVEF